jgi:multicomponent Na+:H+ antiporter subunit F
MSALMVVNFVGLAVAAVLALARVLRRGSLADRALGLDVFVTVVAAGVVLGSVRADSTVFLPIVVVAALLAFVATVTVARFIEERGA